MWFYHEKNNANIFVTDPNRNWHGFVKSKIISNFALIPLCAPSGQTWIELSMIRIFKSVKSKFVSKFVVIDRRQDSKLGEIFQFGSIKRFVTSPWNWKKKHKCCDRSERRRGICAKNNTACKKIHACHAICVSEKTLYFQSRVILKNN